MIVVDTSALMAVLLNEAEAESCAQVLTDAENIVISAGTLAEARIVAERRGIGEEMAGLISGLGMEVTSVTELAASQVARSYAIWGKGVHPACLNFGDCFAYALAKERDCPLLFVGDDLSKTDLKMARPEQVSGMLRHEGEAKTLEEMEAGVLAEAKSPQSLHPRPHPRSDIRIPRTAGHRTSEPDRETPRSARLLHHRSWPDETGGHVRPSRSW